ncbi:hypothetical protein EXIGLDRAFT_844893 [Exidia glandulosa HHB12029]|uniref:F-box domain-containing protein n=1 Tax=Exidia glandulosa HHB12029 TaxID=1314781 RepID=A0A165ZB85_EXIGL|nr:hypothetical protein EXIGLDRAFT_844893 [Exidia glandulosa HHB12029]
MEASHFTRPFPLELEHEILGDLGQRDLIITALVCQRFRDISVSLLFRHIARWSTFVGAEGKPQYNKLPRSYLALFRIIDEPALGRHVRFLDVCAVKILGSWPYDIPRRASKEELHMFWLSMPGLVALSITGRIYCGPDLGLTDVHFPRLKRLRMDEPEECPEFVMRHLNTLTHLCISHDSKLSIENATAVALAQYEGPFDIFMQQLRFRSESLESCTLMGDVGEHVSLSLASLTNLRRLLLGLRINEKTMLELLSSCDKFPRVEDVVICYGDENDRTVQHEPPWQQLLAPFPSARHILVFLQSWDSDWILEKRFAWADEIAQICKEVVAVAFDDDAALRRRSPNHEWEIDQGADEIAEIVAPFVVRAVPR